MYLCCKEILTAGCVQTRRRPGLEAYLCKGTSISAERAGSARPNFCGGAIAVIVIYEWHVSEKRISLEIKLRKCDSDSPPSLQVTVIRFEMTDYGTVRRVKSTCPSARWRPMIEEARATKLNWRSRRRLNRNSLHLGIARTKHEIQSGQLERGADRRGKGAHRKWGTRSWRLRANNGCKGHGDCPRVGFSVHGCNRYSRIGGRT